MFTVFGSTNRSPGVGAFDLAWMFRGVIAAMLGIAVLVLSVARSHAGSR
jgi:hypothetical protein